MRRAERARAASSPTSSKPAIERLRGDFQRLVLGHRRQDAGQARARASTCRCRAGRSSAGVPARRGDLERALGVRLALDVGEVRASAARRVGGAGRCGVDQRRCRQLRAHLQQAASPAARRRRAAPPRRRCRRQHQRRPRGVAAAPSPARRAPGAARRSARARRRIRSRRTRRGDLAGGGEDASAIGRSKRPPSLGRSAGARLTVMRRAGIRNCAFWTPRARGRALSCTSVSGRPTSVKPAGRWRDAPRPRTGGASMPSNARLCDGGDMTWILPRMTWLIGGRLLSPWRAAAFRELFAASRRLPPRVREFFARARQHFASARRIPRGSPGRACRAARHAGLEILFDVLAGDCLAMQRPSWSPSLRTSIVEERSVGVRRIRVHGDLQCWPSEHARAMRARTCCGTHKEGAWRFCGDWCAIARCVGHETSTH